MSRQYLSAGRLVEHPSLLKNRTQVVGKEEYCLAVNTLKYKTVLTAILSKCDIGAANPGEGSCSLSLGVSEGVMSVMIYELLFGRGNINGGGAVKRKIMKHASQLRDALSQLLADKGETDHASLLSETVRTAFELPKYVRINLIKWGAEEGLAYTRRSLFSEAVVDTLLPCVIALPATVKSLGIDPMVVQGNLIVQDKASCFTSQILFDEWAESIDRGDFLDCCAAPGNKTSHLASQLCAHNKKKEAHNSSSSLSSALKGKGDKTKTTTTTTSTTTRRSDTAGSQVFAFEKSETRCALLKNRMQQAGADSVVNVRNEDFLASDSNNELYQRVTACLVDPSCSGSGVHRSFERLTDDSSKVKNPERLHKLRTFQIQCIQKAMSFPSVRLVAYSTCSVHMEENESVVAEVLSALDVDGESECEWVLTDPYRFTDWTRRGLEHPGLDACQSNCLIRALPEDGTNGFFVALFRKNPRYRGKGTNFNSFTSRGSSGVTSNSCVKPKENHIVPAVGKKDEERINKGEKRKETSSLFGRGFHVQKRRK